MTVDVAPAPFEGYQVSLPEFEGPLDLLLHLIQKHELDIFDIPVAFVTERYLEYLTIMQSLDLDVAPEVTTERVSISERIQEIVERLKTSRSARFDELFDVDQTRMDLVVTFLALLEMTRLHMTRLYQTGPLEPLHVTLVLVEVTEA